ncbi:MAG: hypothetical protein GX025_06995 [Clostridiales bacterium]|nr:hypothetical protein [Clostridiales bacterium]
MVEKAKKKARKTLALGLALLLCVGMLSAFFQVRAAGLSEISISPWAKKEVAAAYEIGLIAEGFGLGADYRLPVTRLQLARLATDFVIAEKKSSIISPDETAAYSAETKIGSSNVEMYSAEIETLSAKTEVGSSEVDAGSEEIDIGVSETETSPAEVETASEETETQAPENSKTPIFFDTENPYAALANELGIMHGFDGFFRPEDKITRAEAAAVLKRCMAALGVTEANKEPMVFSDTYSIPRWAVEAVKFVSGRTDSFGTALMSGSAGLFSSNGNFTIEQAILTILRMHNSLSVTEVFPDWREVSGYNHVQLALTFGGDCTFGRGKNFSYSGSFDEMYDKMGPEYFFSGISEFFDDDLTMVNFEGTLTNSNSAAVKTFVFKGRPEYAQILPAGSIDIVTIANNHSMDYLQKGFSDTIEHLSPVVAISGYERLPIVNVKGVNVGFASNVGWGFDEGQKRFIRNSIESLRAAGADLVVFNYHWGIERAYRSNATQRAIAHYCIDQGADLVIGHHPHVVQETETYKGKQIAYSLGNLVFGGNHNPADKNCLIFRQNFTLDLDSRKIVSESHEAIPYRVSSVNYRNDYHPVRAS